MNLPLILDFNIINQPNFHIHFFLCFQSELGYFLIKSLVGAEDPALSPALPQPLCSHGWTTQNPGWLIVPLHPFLHSRSSSAFPILAAQVKSSTHECLHPSFIKIRKTEHFMGKAPFFIKVCLCYGSWHYLNAAVLCGTGAGTVWRTPLMTFTH